MAVRIVTPSTTVELNATFKPAQLNLGDRDDGVLERANGSRQWVRRSDGLLTPAPYVVVGTIQSEARDLSTMRSEAFTIRDAVRAAIEVQYVTAAGIEKIEVQGGAFPRFTQRGADRYQQDVVLEFWATKDIAEFEAIILDDPGPIDAPEVQYGYAMASTPDGFHAFGFHVGGDSGTRHQAYNVMAASWSTPAPLPVGRSNPCAAYYNGKIYVFGGRSGGGLGGDSSQNQIYDLATDTWSTGANLTANRSAAVCALVADFIYVIGGYSNTLQTSTNYRYNPSTNTWTTMTAMPSGRAEAAGAVLDGKIYITGGGATPSATIVYDPATNTWATLANLNIPRRRHAAAAFGGKLYVFGGLRTDTNAITDTVEVYEPVADTWTPISNPLPTARQYMSAHASSNRIYVFGGVSSTVLTTLEAYNPTLNSWFP